MFDCSSDNISLHLKDIYNEEELLEEATVEEFSVVQKEGKGNLLKILSEWKEKLKTIINRFIKEAFSWIILN